MADWSDWFKHPIDSFKGWVMGKVYRKMEDVGDSVVDQGVDTAKQAITAAAPTIKPLVPTVENLVGGSPSGSQQPQGQNQDSGNDDIISGLTNLLNGGGPSRPSGQPSRPSGQPSSSDTDSSDSPLGGLFGGLGKILGAIAMAVIGLIIGVISLFTGESPGGILSFFKSMLGIGSDGTAESQIGTQTGQQGRTALSDVGHGQVIKGAREIYQTGRQAVGNLSETARAMNFLETHEFGSQHVRLTHEQAAGILGNIYQESSMKPYASNNINGGHYGLVQWDGGRQQDFRAWAGKDIHGSSMEEQLSFMMYEMTDGKEQKAGKALFATRTVKEASDAFCIYNERCGDYGAETARRARYAENISTSVSGQYVVQNVDHSPTAPPFTPPQAPDFSFAKG